MNAQETIEQLIHDYPTLFGKRIDVLNQLFLIYGNGYRWGKNGTPVEAHCEECTEDCTRDCGCTCKEENTKPDTISKLNVYTRAIDYSPSLNLSSMHVGYSMITQIPSNVRYDWRVELTFLLDSIISGKSKIKEFKGEYGVELNPVRRAKIIKMALRVQHVNASYPGGE